MLSHFFKVTKNKQMWVQTTLYEEYGRKRASITE